MDKYTYARYKNFIKYATNDTFSYLSFLRFSLECKPI